MIPWRAVAGVTIGMLMVVSSAYGDERLTLRVEPSTMTHAVQAPITLEMDASFLGPDAFRRIDVHRGDVKIQSFEAPRVRLTGLKLPPGRHYLRVEAVSQDWRRWQKSWRITVRDPQWRLARSLKSYGAYSVDKWNGAFLARYGLAAIPFEVNDPTWDADDFAWNLGYMLRAHVVMARLTGSRYYLDKAGRLVHLIFDNTDAKRAARGELDVQKEPYTHAPDAIFADRSLVAPGWRRVKNGKTDTDVLLDGHILHHVMLYVDLVLSDGRFSAHESFARKLLPTIREIFAFHDSMWRDNHHPSVPGSYYYSDGKGGKWNAPRVFNHSATMLSAMLLYDMHASLPQARDRARRLVAYWLRYVRETDDGAYLWDYDPFQPKFNPPAQDAMHGHMDIEFLVLAHEVGIAGITADHLRKIAETFKTRIYRGDGDVAYRVDGTDLDIEPWSIDSYALGWLQLADYDPDILPLVEAVFAKHKTKPNWERSLLGWANLMEHHVRAN